MRNVSGWIIFIAVAVGVMLLSTLGILKLQTNEDTPANDNSSAYYQVYEA